MMMMMVLLTKMMTMKMTMLLLMTIDLMRMSQKKMSQKKTGKRKEQIIRVAEKMQEEVVKWKDLAEVVTWKNNERIFGSLKKLTGNQLRVWLRRLCEVWVRQENL